MVLFVIYTCTARQVNSTQGHASIRRGQVQILTTAERPTLTQIADGKHATGESHRGAP